MRRSRARSRRKPTRSSRSVTIPTLVIAGDEDLVCPPQFSHAIRAVMPHAQVAVIRGGAHQPFQEKPDEYNAIVAAFWARVDRRRPIAAAGVSAG